ncbi:phosphate ABC transporter permease subunit PstC [Nocardioides campestrisoli]|uniref:phosphate ABC transporter permease subunit PstC n=1 Tax=Nocardioides campestrisoli TaxID=2736757 RepID=UPI0015E64241|nr:phosphate ABC transporter permease subunit PstC [Nocardioides campestrisoli]
MSVSPASVAPARVRRTGDLVFAGLARAAGILILVALAGVAIFLTLEGVPAITAPANRIGADNIVVYVWPLLYGTLLAATLAILVAAPLSIALALVISHYAPRRLARPIGYLIDLLAAVPSVVYGLWGIQFLAPRILPVYEWLAEHLGWLPFFEGPANGRSILTASLVLAIMALPIITAICREIFAQTPTLHQEAALALGATRWEMIRMTVFPYARSGMISAIMLGLGRALGETMAVAMVLSATGVITINLISSVNPSTIAANIALGFPEASGLRVNVLIFSGLVLFVVTFVVNFLARLIATRGTVKGGR